MPKDISFFYSYGCPFYTKERFDMAIFRVKKTNVFAVIIKCRCICLETGIYES